MSKIIYVAIDLMFNGSPCTVTTHLTAQEAKDALHFRMQCDADGNLFDKIEWVEIVSSEECDDPVIIAPKGVYENKCIIYVTVLGNKY